MRRVVYSAEFTLDVDADTESMALHTAGEMWPEIREAVEALACAVKIRDIRVDPVASVALTKQPTRSERTSPPFGAPKGGWE